MQRGAYSIEMVADIVMGIVLACYARYNWFLVLLAATYCLLACLLVDLCIGLVYALLTLSGMYAVVMMLVCVFDPMETRIGY